MQTFDEMLDDAENEEATNLSGGDVCPEEGCEKELFELHHERNSQLDAPRHPDAPELELVCIHHGIVDGR